MGQNEDLEGSVGSQVVSIQTPLCIRKAVCSKPRSRRIHGPGDPLCCLGAGGWSTTNELCCHSMERPEPEKSWRCLKHDF